MITEREKLVTTDGTYNALLGLKDWNPAAERVFTSTGFNNLEIGKEYIVRLADKKELPITILNKKNFGKWAGEDCNMVDLGGGVICHDRFIASCVVVGSSKESPIYGEGKSKCLINAFFGKDMGIKALYDYMLEDGSFPKFRVRDILPLAMPTHLLKSGNVKEETKLVYMDKLGVDLNEVDAATIKYLPSWKAGPFGAFQTKIALVEVLEGNEKPKETEKPEKEDTEEK